MFITDKKNPGNQSFDIPRNFINTLHIPDKGASSFYL